MTRYCSIFSLSNGKIMQVVARISLIAEKTANAPNKDTSGPLLQKSRPSQESNWISTIQIPCLNSFASMHSSFEKLGGSQLFVSLQLLSNDYVLPAEPILDYVTRFSGITCDDLNPNISTHAIITHRAAVLKLR